MTLRPEYSLSHSPYNAFLFAAIGEEQATGPLTVLTALTRLGYDPWNEAARLSDLPREAAARAVAGMIMMLPEGDWNSSEVEAVATRLVGWLPMRSSQPVPPVGVPPVETRKVQLGVATMLAWSALAAALLYFTVNYFSSNNLEVGGRQAPSTQRSDE